MPTREQRARSLQRKLSGLAHCCRCNLDKPQSEFDLCPGRRPFGLSSHCKSCNGRRKADQKKKKYWLMPEIERQKINRILTLKKFGITVERYDEMFSEQHGVCAICKQPETDVHPATGQVQRLAVDHDHKTGVVRGLLCAKCNKGIGSFLENESYLLAAVDYLRKEVICHPAEGCSPPATCAADCSGPQSESGEANQS
jgi:hypothetical protein